MFEILILAALKIAVLCGVMFFCMEMIFCIVEWLHTRKILENKDMKVLILGFKKVDEVEDVMEQLIVESGRYIFTVVVNSKGSVAQQWAEMAGCPVQYVEGKGERLLKKLVESCDYVVLKNDADTPQWMKNLVMRFKQAGKHGTIIR